ncbi:transposable element Tc1 transposase [Trichonephila clavipes]|nr:transposable element Tc1 transposase [Trichonephila clavipes]
MEVERRFHPSTPRKEDHEGGHGKLECNGIMLNGRTELHNFESSSLRVDHYYDEIILPHMYLFQVVIGLNFIYADYNARPHRTSDFEELLQSVNTRRMNWPACSPDLNSIEHEQGVSVHVRSAGNKIISSGQHQTALTEAL